MSAPKPKGLDTCISYHQGEVKKTGTWQRESRGEDNQAAVPLSFIHTRDLNIAVLAFAAPSHHFIDPTTSKLCT